MHDFFVMIGLCGGFMFVVQRLAELIALVWVEIEQKVKRG
jgi:hypothetical protein